ncbi:MAG TPA: sulfotransferase [Gaiellaceae bacterium]|nr:sulfotransferase [Gaiellaceae bacterium]
MNEHGTSSRTRSARVATRSTSSTKAPTPARARRQRALVVLGMHRSGTSALARVLSLLGARLPDNLLTGDDTPGNPLGFWEPARVVELHEELLGASGRTWFDLEPFTPEWFTSDLVLSYVSRLADVVREEYAKAPLLVVKDPRISRLVPLWLEVFERLDIEPLFVIALRNPLEVAASHAQRDQFRFPLSLLLWLRHMLDAEAATRGHQRVVVSYDDLLADWRPVVAHMGRQLGVQWPRASHTSELEIDGFLRHDARHHTIADEELESRDDLSPWVRDTYRTLRRISHRQTPHDLRALDAIRDEVNKSELAWGSIVHDSLHRLQAERARSSERITELDEERTRLVAERSAAADAAQTELAALRAQHEQTAATLAERDAERPRLDAAVAELEHQLEQLQDRLAERSAAADATQTELAALREQHAQTAAALAALTAELARVRRDLGDRLARKEQELGRNLEELELFAEAQAAARVELETLRRDSRTLAALIAGGRIGTHRQQSRSQLFAWLAGGRLRLVLSFLRTRRAREVDALEYLLRYEDVSAAGLNPVMHYVEFGRREGRDPGTVGPPAPADAEKSVRRVPRWRTVSQLGAWLVRGRVRFLVRYVRIRRSGRFDAAAYLAANPDVATVNMNPLTHYIAHGAGEGRPMRPAPAPEALPAPAATPSRTRRRNAVAGVVKRNVPESSAVCLIHAYEDDDLDLGPRRVWRLQADMSAEQLVSAIEHAREEGATHVLVTADALPLIDTRRGLSDYLSHYTRPVMRRDHDCALFFLAGGRQAPARTGGLAEIVSAVVPRTHSLVIIGPELDGGSRVVLRLPEVEPNGVMTESLAQFRAQGARYLALSADQLPAFERHDDLRRYVDNNYRVIVRRDGVGIVYETVDSPAPRSAGD